MVHENNEAGGLWSGLAPWVGTNSRGARLEYMPVVPMIDWVSLSLADAARLCGVYFLWEDDALVYIGQSCNVLGRIAQHSNDERPFNHATMLATPERHLKAAEAVLLYLVRPPQRSRRRLYCRLQVCPGMITMDALQWMGRHWGRDYLYDLEQHKQLH